MSTVTKLPNNDLRLVMGNDDTWQLTHLGDEVWLTITEPPDELLQQMVLLATGLIAARAEARQAVRPVSLGHWPVAPATQQKRVPHD